ncbi:hypothetical protein N752_06445 [Desulforamulus aquiferis]|nr:hypothetical protein N752_06445 [Desulforamulus aquiferis]
MKLQGTMIINDLGHLEIGGCDTVELAKDYGTPLYVIDEELFRQNCRDYYQAFTETYGAEVIYASKTLSNLAICAIVNQEAWLRRGFRRRAFHCCKSQIPHGQGIFSR